jgi:hypothetical protein
MKSGGRLAASIRDCKAASFYYRPTKVSIQVACSSSLSVASEYEFARGINLAVAARAEDIVVITERSCIGAGVENTD